MDKEKIKKLLARGKGKIVKTYAAALSAIKDDKNDLFEDEQSAQKNEDIGPLFTSAMDTADTPAEPASAAPAPKQKRNYKAIAKKCAFAVCAAAVIAGRKTYEASKKAYLKIKPHAKTGWQKTYDYFKNIDYRQEVINDRAFFIVVILILIGFNFQSCAKVRLLSSVVQRNNAEITNLRSDIQTLQLSQKRVITRGNYGRSNRANK